MKRELLIIGGVAAAIGGFLLVKSKSEYKKPKAVKNFRLDRYLGKWYEIARIDFKFEKNLNNTTAEYSLNEDGSVKVLNKGYNFEKESWQESEGKAKFHGDSNIGRLKVSFFGPFYSDYNVIAVEENYKYALVVGKNRDYLWILSREKEIPKAIKNKFLIQAIEIGYDIDDLVWVDHN